MARRFIRQGKKIDFKSWAAIPSLQTGFSTETTIIGGSLAFSGPATILRCRGGILARLDATKQVGDLMKVTTAIGIVSSDAFAAGAGSVPDPASEPEYPWLWWNSFTLSSQIAAGTDDFGLSVRAVEVDTKAMRKIKPGESLLWVMQSSASAGSLATSIFFEQTRVLVGT